MTTAELQEAILAASADIPADAIEAALDLILADEMDAPEDFDSGDICFDPYI